MEPLKQSTARNLMVFMVDDTDHVTGKTGLTLTITASKDGAAFGSISPTVTERGNGWYNIALTSSHTDTLGDLALHITGTAADPLDLVRPVEVDRTGASVSSVTGAVASVTGNVGGNVTGSVGSVVGAVGSVTGLTASDVAAIKLVTDKVEDTLEDDGGFYRFTAEALAEAPTGGSAPSAADIADAVWDEAAADHVTSGTTGAALGAAGSAGDPWETSLPGAYGSGTAGKIIGDNLDATVGSRATQTSVDDLPTNAELATSQAAADDATLAAIAALNNLSAGQVRTELATELGRIDAAVSTRATPAQVATELGTYDAPTKAELDAGLAALNNLSSAQVQTAAEAALTAYDGPTKAELDSAVDTLPTAAETATAVLAAADSNPIAANVQEINDVALTGDGSSTPWGPAA